MKSIPVPSMVQGIHEMDHYWQVLKQEARTEENVFVEDRFKTRLAPLLPKDTRDVPKTEHEDSILATTQNINTAVDNQWNGGFSERLQLKMWHDSYLDHRSEDSDLMFRPPSPVLKKLERTLGIVSSEKKTAPPRFTSPQRVRRTDTIKTPPTAKRTARDKSSKTAPSPFKADDWARAEKVREADTQAMAAAMDSIRIDTFEGIPAREFSSTLDDTVDIFLNTIEYVARVLEHFEDYIIQRHCDTKQASYGIGNGIHISGDEYVYLQHYVRKLKEHTLPALKDKIQAAASNERVKIKRALDMARRLHERLA